MRDWVDRIHLNDSSLSEREGRRVVVKRRRAGSGFVMRFANAFFRAARNPVEAITTRETWQQWEVECYLRLHGPEFSAGMDESGTAWIEVLPGRSLGEWLSAGTLDREMLRAAGAELRRAHRQDCPHYGSGWSHGDPHSGNFLYDPASRRARLIDFEVRHLRQLPEVERHADDVLVLLQDVCGRCNAEQWPSLASALIEGYGKKEITSTILGRLNVPAGIPRLWWAVRTTWMKRDELERRLEQLKQILKAGAEQSETVESATARA